RRGHCALRRDDRHRPGRHQARARLLDDEPDRLHVPGGGHRCLFRGYVPPPLTRLLQGPAVHGRRQRDPRDARRAGHAQVRRPVELPHEAPPVMLVPVAILAVLAVVGGFIQTRALGVGPSAVSDFLSAAVGPQESEESAAVVGIGLLTMVLAAGLFAAAMRIRPWSARVPWAQRLLEHKYYFDEIFDAAFVRPMDWVAGFAQRDIEKPIIDGVVIDTGAVARAGAGGLSLTQSGYFRNYVLVFVGGAVVAAVILLVRASS